VLEPRGASVKQHVTRLRSAVRVGAFSVLIAGCRQIVGIGDQPPSSGTSTDAGSSCGTATFGGAHCQSCMHASCCTEAAACAAVDDCGKLADCLGACNPQDATCTSGCRSSFASGDGPEAASVQSCEAARCASACGLACGGYIFADAACAACGRGQCCTQAGACMQDAECARLAACELACAPLDDDCLGLCELAHPSGVALERALGDCTATKCAASCIAPQWTCLENPVGPGSPPPITVTFSLSDYMSGKGIGGLSIVGCSFKDHACTQPTAVPAVTTDANGFARVSLPNGFGGYLQVSGNLYGDILVFLPPSSRDLAIAWPLPTLTVAAAAIGQVATPDAEDGTLLAIAHDCAGSPAGGVHFTLSPSANATPFYFQGQVVSPTPTETSNPGGFAAGGFVNVQADAELSLGAEVVENSLPYVPQTVFVRQGGLSYVWMGATPP